MHSARLATSKLLLAPEQKGVIQFIGSFLFGSFPQQAYAPLLGLLRDQGYSIVLYRFPLNPLQFNHWEVAIGLYREQLKIRALLSSYGEPPAFSWLGHSLGCKFIVLLEVLSHAPLRRQELLRTVLGAAAASELLRQIESSWPAPPFIRDQPSVFLAPEISNTVRLLRSSWRLRSPGTRPNQLQTEELIKGSPELFNLTGLVRFRSDSIAEDDVSFLEAQLAYRQPYPPLVQDLEGWHFEPLGLHVETLSRTIVSGLELLRSRITPNLTL